MVKKHNQYKELLVRVRTGCVISERVWIALRYRWLGAFCFLARKLLIVLQIMKKYLVFVMVLGFLVFCAPASQAKAFTLDDLARQISSLSEQIASLKAQLAGQAIGSTCSIVSFTATPSVINPGGTSVLTWTLSGCTGMSMSTTPASSWAISSPGFGGSGGSKTVSLNASMTFSLVAYGNLNSIQKNITVSINPVSCSNNSIIGDTNADGKVNPTDALLIGRVVSGALPYPSNSCCADVNSDGNIDSTDAKMVNNYFVKLPAGLVGKTCSSLWQRVGLPGFSTQASGNNPSIKIDSNGLSYVAYVDNFNQIKVMKFNGTSWDNISPTGFSAKSFLSLALDSKNIPYVAYANASDGKARLIKLYDPYSPYPLWQDVGGAGFGESATNDVSVALDSNNLPYVAYTTVEGLIIQKFDGASWNNVGSSIYLYSNPSMGPNAYSSLSLDSNNVPYVVYTEEQSKQITVLKFNGTSWVNVGQRGFASGGAYDVSLVLDHNNTPYIAYSNTNISNSYKFNIFKFNGTSWVTVSPGNLSSTEFPLAIDSNNIPYIATRDGGVFKFNSTSWAKIGSFIPSGPASFALDLNNIPYVAYVDALNNSKISVMRYK